MMQKMVSPTSLRIIVLGAQEVGKSALTVRFLTQRFIGEYSSQKDLLYCTQAQLDGLPVDLEILDTSRDQTDCLPLDKGQWADGFAVVFSVASRSSLLVAADCLRHLRQSGAGAVLLLGNKRDLEHRREVSPDEGKALAAEFGCTSFAEVSAAEGHAPVASAFRDLLRASLPAPPSSPPTSGKRKISVVSVSKIISAVFGRASSDHLHHHNQKKRPSLSL